MSIFAEILLEFKMNVAIIITSKYGHAMKVAKMISRELKNCKVTIIDLNTCSCDDISEYDMIILGSCLSMGKYSKEMYDFALDNIEILTTKPSGLFMCGVEHNINRQEEELINAYSKPVFEYAKVKSFFCNECILEKLNIFDRFFMKKDIKEDKNAYSYNEIVDFARKINFNAYGGYKKRAAEVR